MLFDSVSEVNRFFLLREETSLMIGILWKHCWTKGRTRDGRSFFSLEEAKKQANKLCFGAERGLSSRKEGELRNYGGRFE